MCVYVCECYYLLKQCALFVRAQAKIAHIAIAPSFVKIDILKLQISMRYTDLVQIPKEKIILLIGIVSWREYFQEKHESHTHTRGKHMRKHTAT